MNEPIRYTLRPGCTTEECQAVVGQLREAMGRSGIASPGPGSSWLSMALATIEEIESGEWGNSAALKVIDSLAASGILVHAPASVPAARPG